VVFEAILNSTGPSVELPRAGNQSIPPWLAFY